MSGKRSMLEEKWTKPLEGWKKLNVDAALDISNKKMGFDFMLRDVVMQVGSSSPLEKSLDWGVQTG